MNISNIHKRIINKPITEVGALLNSLSSKDDQLWPHEKWPRMKFDRDLSVGATGGHGPIRYVVTEFEPGKKIKFKFTGPSGFHGSHWLELKEVEGIKTEIKHTIRMDVSGSAVISWPIIFGPLHDALIENSFDKAQQSFEQCQNLSIWSPWVIFLRWLLKNKKRA